MKSTRALLFKKIRPIKHIKKYGFHFEAYSNVGYAMIPFRGIINKNNSNDKLNLHKAVSTLNTSGIYGTSYSIINVKQFSNWGAVIVSASTYTGD
jgi:hypothetical protein